MFNLSTIVPDLLANLSFILPIRGKIVHCYEQGVKFSFGVPVGRCNHKTGMKIPVFSWSISEWNRWCRTGIHFFCPWFQKIVVRSNQETVIETQFQTLTTKDNVQVSVSFTVAYKVFNLLYLTTKVTEFEHSLENRCQSVVTECFVRFDFQNIKTNPSILTEQIQTTLEDVLQEWGVRILHVGMVNMTQTKNIRLISNPGDIA